MIFGYLCEVIVNLLRHKNFNRLFAQFIELNVKITQQKQARKTNKIVLINNFYNSKRTIIQSKVNNLLI